MTLENTENQILKAAREVFIAKGYEGARMQEIADRAGINKALLHYYFRSKEKLFEAVFSEIAMNLFPAMKQLLEAEIGIKEKVTFFIKIYLKTLLENPFFLRILIIGIGSKVLIISNSCFSVSIFLIVSIITLKGSTPFSNIGRTSRVILSDI